MGIARKYQINIAELQRANGISDPHVLRAGMSLRIPSKQNRLAEARPQNMTPAPVGGHGMVATHVVTSASGKRLASRLAPQSKVESIKRPQQEYTVQANDNLWRIARVHNVSVEDLKRWNGVDERNLRVGAKLVVQK